MKEITIELTDALNKAKAMAYLGYEIPGDLNLLINSLIFDYNEALKR